MLASGKPQTRACKLTSGPVISVDNLPVISIDKIHSRLSSLFVAFVTFLAGFDFVRHLGEAADTLFYKICWIPFSLQLNKNFGSDIINSFGAFSLNNTVFLLKPSCYTNQANFFSPLSMMFLVGHFNVYNFRLQLLKMLEKKICSLTIYRFFPYHIPGFPLQFTVFTHLLMSTS